MNKSGHTPEESRRINLAEWCFEIGTDHESHTRENAEFFNHFLAGNNVVDLGSGDGAANKGFKGRNITAVDINEVKLERNTAKTKKCKDFVEYLESVDSIDNLFSHHSLEHSVNCDRAIELINEKVKGCVFIAVPARDGVHESHHVNFDSIEDIQLPNFDPIWAGELGYANLTEIIFIGVRR